jgi:hypothetical protein
LPDEARRLFWMNVRMFGIANDAMTPTIAIVVISSVSVKPRECTEFRMAGTLRGRIAMFKAFATSGFGAPTSGGGATINDDPVHISGERARVTVAPPAGLARAGRPAAGVAQAIVLIGVSASSTILPRVLRRHLWNSASS